jgi:ribonuclease HII
MAQTPAQRSKPILTISQLLQSPQLQQNKLPTRQIEEILYRDGFLSICGIDEAGRGAFAGPLVASAVILSDKNITGLNDSKKLTERQRDVLATKIKDCATWSVAQVGVDFINSHGIQEASYVAYKKAISSLDVKTDFVLLDYYEIPGFSLPQLGIKFGDRISESIAAASIIAKTHRDNLMKQMSDRKPFRNYSFDKHKGYGTKLHRDAICRYGLSPQHRLLYCKNCIR